MTERSIFYDYFKDLDVLKERKLPDIKFFANKLNNEECDELSYWYAKRIWSIMNMKTLKDYHDLYLKLDVVILQDFFETFRKLCLQDFGLDPVNYYSTPGFAWDAALKFTGVRLETLVDETMYSFLEDGSRGGVSQISRRHARANNKYLEDYNPDEPTVYLIYLDAVNLYGKVMADNLPTHGFRWLPKNDWLLLIEKKKMGNWQIKTELDLDGNDGFILEVDMKIPEELHDETNCYPLAPEDLEITEDMLSKYQKENFPKHYKKSSKKLTPNLLDKKRYAVHLKNLKFYQDKGIIVTKVHRILTFKQSKWLKSYIEFNTARRNEATYDFARD